jgi:hypothetical protein
MNPALLPRELYTMLEIGEFGLVCADISSPVKREVNRVGRSIALTQRKSLAILKQWLACCEDLASNPVAK